MIKFIFVVLFGIIFLFCEIQFVQISNNFDLMERTIKNQDFYIKRLEQEIIQHSIDGFDIILPESPEQPLPQDPQDQLRTWMT